MSYLNFMSLPENAFDFAAFLLLATIKLSILLGGIYLICRLFRRVSAATKHFILMTGLCAGLLLPFLFTGKDWQIPILPAQISSAGKSFQADFPTKIKENEQELNGSIARVAPDKSSVVPIDAGTTSQSKFYLGLNEISSWLIVIWLAGALLLLFRLAVGIITTNERARWSTTVVNPVLMKLAADLSGHLNVKGRVRLFTSEYVPMPVVCGLWHSKVLLPENFKAWPEEQRRGVLLHELAHVKRRDCLTQLLAQIICALYWFNPLVWLAARNLRMLRELACDDYVLNAGTKPSVYAGHLLDIARLMQAKTFFDSSRTATVAIARKSQIETRLLAILDSRQNRWELNRVIKTCVIFTVAVFALPLSALQFKSQLKDSADTTENFIVRKQEPVYKVSNENKDYFTLSKQSTSIESFKVVTNKRAQVRPLNKSNFENAGGVQTDISKVPNSNSRPQENSDEAENAASLSTKQISNKLNHLGRLAPLNSLQSNLGPLKGIKTRPEINRKLTGNP